MCLATSACGLLINPTTHQCSPPQTTCCPIQCKVHLGTNLAWGPLTTSSTNTKTPHVHLKRSVLTPWSKNWSKSSSWTYSSTTSLWAFSATSASTAALPAPMEATACDRTLGVWLYIA